MRTVQIIFYSNKATAAQAAIAYLLPQLFTQWQEIFACSITYDAGVPYYSELVEEFLISNDELIEDYRFVPCDNDLVEVHETVKTR